MIDTVVVTDSTTREELISYINDLEEDNQKLSAEISEQRQEIEDLSLAPVQLERLEEAADLMAEQGRIHNTPYAKQQWIDGK